MIPSPAPHGSELQQDNMRHTRAVVVDLGCLLESLGPNLRDSMYLLWDIAWTLGFCKFPGNFNVQPSLGICTIEDISASQVLREKDTETA